jgi:dTDP-4-dehydrorhamnose reductase
MIMRKIIVTGALGQLGKAVLKEYETDPDVLLVPVSHQDLAIENLDSVRGIFLKEQPDVVINCAAYTNVDGCEQRESEANRINGVGPRNLAIYCEKVGAKLIQISTDYVFNGCGERPYRESDRPMPVSAYGRSKLVGEMYTANLCTRHMIIRTAWLYGDGKNFLNTMLSLSKDHDKITVVDDQIGCPTSTAELARMIHYLEPTEQYGLYHGVCRGQVSWAGFAKEIFHLKNIATEVVPITTEEYKRQHPTSANRPQYSVLENQMLTLIFPEGEPGFVMKDWKTALKDYLEGRC